MSSLEKGHCLSLSKGARAAEGVCVPSSTGSVACTQDGLVGVGITGISVLTDEVLLSARGCGGDT